MKFKQFRPIFGDKTTILSTYLTNRGIEDWEGYINLNERVIIDGKLLRNMNKGIQMFAKHYENNDKIVVLIDPDVDGYVSGGSLYRYVKRLDENYPIEYVMHTRAKAHGINGIGKDFVLPEDCKLFIIPDGGTNDVDTWTMLNEQGIDVLILDHHEAEEKTLEYINNLDTEYKEYCTVIVNNQTSPLYENKNFSGVGIVYKFIKELDEYYWCDFADEYLDLVALGNIGDSMDIRSFETKYYIQEGLKNIKNEFFLALLQAQEYSTKGIVNIHNISWYIVSTINGCIRFGSFEEKELMFRALCGLYEEFEYNKRATKSSPATTIIENIYDRGARLAKNAKSRQDKAREKALIELSSAIDETFEEEKTKVVIVDGSEINSALTGVVAMKIAEKYSRPCIVLHDHRDNEDEEISFIGGSARNCDNSPVESLKDIINKCTVATSKGHSNASGVEVKLNKTEKFVVEMNELLKDVIYDGSVLIDYIFDASEFTASMVAEFDKLVDYYGTSLDESKVVIKNIVLNKDDCSLMGKQLDTVSFMLEDDVKAIAFSSVSGELIDWLGDDTDISITIDIVCTPQINIYEGIKQPQVIIDDMEIRITSDNTKSKVNNTIDTEDDYDDPWA